MEGYAACILKFVDVVSDRHKHRDDKGAVPVLPGGSIEVDRDGNLEGVGTGEGDTLGI